MLLKIDFKTVNTVLSHTFNHKICFKYVVYIVGCVWFVFNGKIELFFYCRRRPSLLKVPNVCIQRMQSLCTTTLNVEVRLYEALLLHNSAKSSSFIIAKVTHVYKRHVTALTQYDSPEYSQQQTNNKTDSPTGLS